MLSQFLVRFRKGAPSSFSAFFGPNHTHLWAQFYSTPTSTSAIWQDEGFGSKNAVQVDADEDNIPTVGTLNGKTFPLFYSQDAAGSDHLQATPFNSLDGSNDYTLYGAFVAFKATYGGQNVKLIWQAGSWEVSTFFDSGTGKIHLQVSIQNGLQFTPVVDESVTDDGLVHKWVFTVVAGVGRLYMDGVQLGSDVSGLPAIATDSDPVEIGGNNFWGSVTGGIYLTGIATKGLNALEVGQLFGLITDYLGTINYPTLTTPSPASGPIGGTIGVMGTNFVPGARVFFRDSISPDWIEADNTTYIDDTQIDADIPVGLATGFLDVWVLNGNGLWVVEEDLVAIIPETFNDLFGAADAFRWGHLYSRPGGTTALWENEGSGGWNATHLSVDTDTHPRVGFFDGNAFPWFESLDDEWDQLVTADDFDGLDDEPEATFYGAFSTLSVADGAADGVLMGQAGRIVVYLWWAPGDQRMHLHASIANGDQFTLDDASTIVDDGLVHTWALTVKSDGSAKLFLDRNEIGSITGLSNPFAGNNTNQMRFGRSNFEGPTCGLYLNGIALKSLSDLEIGFLFDLIDDYVGTEPTPTVTGASPALAAQGETVSAEGTDFVNGALVFCRVNGGTPSDWKLADNITFIDSTQIDFDVPVGLSDGDIDVMVMNPTALYGSELAAFEQGIPLSVTSARTVDVAGGDYTIVTGEGFTTVGITTVAIDGTNCPVFVALSDTKLFVQTPAKSAGTKTISLNGGAATGNIKYHDPADANTTLLLERGNFIGDTWTDRASGARHFTNATTFPPETNKEPQLNEGSGSNQSLSSSATWGDLLGGTGGDTWTVTVQFRVRALSATHATPEFSVEILGDAGRYLSFQVTDSGTRINIYSGANGADALVIAAPSLNEWHVLDVESNAGSVRARLDGGSWTTDATAGPPISLASTLSVGAGAFSGGEKFKGDVRVVQVSNVARGDSWFDDNLDWLRSKHGAPDVAGQPEIDSIDSDVFDPAGGDRVFVKGRGLATVSDARIGTTATPNVVGAMGSIPNCDGANDRLAVALGAPAVFNDDAMTGSVLFYARTAGTADSSTPYTEEAICGSQDYADWGLSYSTAGVRFWRLNASFSYTSVVVPCAPRAWHLAQFKYDGTNLKLRVDGGPWVVVASTYAALGSTVTHIGTAHNLSGFFDGLVAEVLLDDAVYTDGEFDSIVGGVNYDYGFNFGGVAASAYSRTTLSPTLLLQPGNYVSGTWTATAGSNATEATNPPAVYSHAAKRFGTLAAHPDGDGDNDLLLSSVAGSTFFNLAAGTLNLLFYVDSAAADNANAYLLPGLFGDAFVMAVSFSVAGVRIALYDSDWRDFTVPCGTKGWHLLQLKWNGTNAFARVDGGAWVSPSTAFTGFVALATGLRVLSQACTGDIESNANVALVLGTNSAQSDTVCDDVLAAVNYKYGFNFGGFSAIDQDFSTYAWTIYLKPGDYDGTTWTGSASAGISGSHNFSQATSANRPRVSDGEHLIATVPAGAATSGTIGAHPKFNGVNTKLVAGGTLDTYFNASVHSGYIAFIPHTIVGDGSPGADNAYLNDVLLGSDTNAWWMLSLRKDGTATIRQAGGAAFNLTVSGIRVGEINLLQWRFASNTLYLRANGGPWSSLGSVDNIGIVTQSLNIGGGIAYTSNEFNGTVLEVGLSDTDLGTTALDNVARGVGADYGVMFGPYEPVAFDRSTLSLTAYWKPTEYTSGTWNGATSAGSSASNDATEATNPPAVATRTIAIQHALTLVNASGITSLAKAIQYANPGTIPDNVLWLRPDGADVDIDGSNFVTEIRDKSGSGDTGRNFTNPSPGTWFTPPWNASDPSYGGKPTMGPFHAMASPNVVLLKSGAWSATYSTFTLGVIGHAPDTSNRYFTYEGATDYNAILNSGGTSFVYSGAADASISDDWPRVGFMPQRAVLSAGFAAGVSRLWSQKVVGKAGILNTHTLGDAGLHVGSYQGDSSTYGVTRLAELYAYSRVLSDRENRTNMRYRDSYYGKAA